MNWIQEQEERDYNPRSDLENLYEQSRRETQLNDPKIAEALDRGKHVVVTSAPAYCPWTDAILGEKTYFESEHDSREEAQQAVAKVFEDDPDWGMGEIGIYVQSPKGTIITDVNDVTGDVTTYDAYDGALVPDDEDVPF